MKFRTEVVVRISITHFSCSPEDITRILRIPPTKTWRAGDLFPRKKNTKNKVSGWVVHSPLPETEGVEEHIEALLSKVHQSLPQFQGLPSDARVRLLVAVEAYDDSQRTMEISKGMIQALAKMGGSLDFEYYDNRVKNED